MRNKWITVTFWSSMNILAWNSIILSNVAQGSIAWAVVRALTYTPHQKVISQRSLGFETFHSKPLGMLAKRKTAMPALCLISVTRVPSSALGSPLSNADALDGLESFSWTHPLSAHCVMYNSYIDIFVGTCTCNWIEHFTSKYQKWKSMLQSCCSHPTVQGHPNLVDITCWRSVEAESGDIFRSLAACHPHTCSGPVDV